MALRFVDSFDHYGSTHVAQKWTVNNGVLISAGNGRRSTSALTMPSLAYLDKTFDPQPTWIVGFAFRPLAYASSRTIVTFLDGGSAQTQLALAADGTLIVSRAGTALTNGTSTLVLTVGISAYIEMKVTIANSISANTCQVRVNGVDWITVATGQDTQATANATANTIRLGPNAALSNTWYYDDLYICDGTGSMHNDFLGDCRVDSLLPTSDGTSQQWTPSTPGTHYTLVDETAPNTTDYVASNTIGHRESYGMQDLAALTSTIYGVQLNLAALKNDAGGRNMKPLLLSGGSESLGAATALSTSQTYTMHVQVTDPATGIAWTEAGVDALQAGAEVA